MAERFDSGTPACQVFAIEELSAGLPKRALSIVGAWVLAIITLGGGTTPVIQKKIVIKEAGTGRVLRELDDFGVDMSLKLKRDIEALSADKFMAEWLPELRSQA